MSLSKVLSRGREFFEHPATTPEGGTGHTFSRLSRSWRIASAATLLLTGAFAKAVMGGAKVKAGVLQQDVHGLQTLLDAQEQARREKRGLVTVMNHNSLLDDPFTWGILPFRRFWRRDNLRWSLGADNVCFSNAFLATYFGLGQVLPTARFGRGPFQGSMDAAIYLLSNPLDRSGLYHTRYTPELAQPGRAARVPGAAVSNWVHVFPEAFVHQVYPPHDTSLRYFKWGVSRLLLESSRPPIVVPMFSTGFDSVIPEDRAPGYSLLAQRRRTVRVRVGQPLDENTLAGFRQRWGDLVDSDPAIAFTGDLTPALRDGEAAQHLRSQVARWLRDEVSQVRADMGLPDQDPRFADPAFWDPVHGGCVDVPVMGIVNKLEHHKQSHPHP